jgi:hypothetical protein
MIVPIVTHYGDPRLTREFWAKVTEDVNTGCWVWDRDKTSKTGTPMHGAKVAWRFAHDRLIVPLVKGATGKRACGEVLCVNPAHRIVTQPTDCPTCHQKMPAPTDRIESMTMTDGRVYVGRVVVDEDGEAQPPPPPDLIPVVRDGPRTVDREGRPSRRKADPDYAGRYRRSHLPKPEGVKRKLTRKEALEGLNIQHNPLPLGDPTGRWEPAETPSGLSTRKVEFTGGRLRLWEELDEEAKSAFNRTRGKEKLEPGTFGREIEDAMGAFD